MNDHQGIQWRTEPHFILPETLSHVNSKVFRSLGSSTKTMVELNFICAEVESESLQVN